MSVQPPRPNPNVQPLPPDEVPGDPARDERPLAPPEGETAEVTEMPDRVI